MPLGVKVTLRGDQMYEFIDRLVTNLRDLQAKGIDVDFWLNDMYNECL